MTGDPDYRWRDKSCYEVFHKNGTVSGSCVHSAVDGMVAAMYKEFYLAFLEECNGVWTGSNKVGV